MEAGVTLATTLSNAVRDNIKPLVAKGIRDITAGLHTKEPAQDKVQ